MTERSGALQEDPLYMSYALIAAKSCGEEEEEGGGEEEAEGGGGEGGEEAEGTSIHVRILRSPEFIENNVLLYLNFFLLLIPHFF